MKDAERVCTRFAGILQNCPKPIAIYGTAGYGKLIARMYWHDITYFMDKDKTSGFFMGKPIVSLEEVSAIQIGTVVMAAGLPAEEIIYERIHEECEGKHIALYGVHTGRLLSTQVGKRLSKENISGKEKKRNLFEEIDRHEIICFDIFDTLLMRYIPYPSDVFDITAYRAIAKGINIPKNFKDYRQQAELAWDRKLPGLDGIYLELQNMLGMSDEETAEIKNIELGVERDVLFPRPGMVEAFAYARSRGKKIILVSDMYLAPDLLKDILVKFDIVGFDKIYVSEFHGTNKCEDLFEIVKTENIGSSYLHIGDNPLADDWPARYHGIDSYLIQSGLEMFRRSDEAKRFAYLSDLNNRVIFGLFLAHAYADPFSLDENNKRHIRDIKEFASIFIEPLIFSFMLWFLREVTNKDYEAVLFSSRDGYVIKKMYDMAISSLKWSDAPKGIYLYTSRRLCMSMSLQDETDLLWVKNRLGHDMGKYMRENFNIDATEGLVDISNDYKRENVFYKDEIFNQSCVLRRNYKRYLEKNDIITSKRYAFYDMCSIGTCQRGLSKTLFPSLCGVYMNKVISKECSTMGTVVSFLPQSVNYMLGINIFEFIFTSPEPTVKSVDNRGDIIFSEENRSVEIVMLQKQLQDAIREDFKTYLKLCVPCKEISSDVGQQILSLYRCGCFCEAVKVAGDFKIIDDLIDKVVATLKPNER